MLRRTKGQVFSELPDPDCEILPIPQEGAQVKELVAQEMNWEKRDARYARSGPEEEHVSTLRHNLAMYKVPIAVKHCKHLLTMTDKLVVWAYHRDVIDQLKKELKAYRPLVIRGGVSAKKKDQYETAFREDPSRRVLIGNYVAAGVSLDFSIADVQVFVEFSWVPGEIDQAMARLENLAKVRKTLCQFCVIQGSLEERMLRTVIDKKETTAEIIEDGDEFSRMLL